MSDLDQRIFRPIPNPYIVGNPIDDRRMFFGREDDFAYIRQKVSGGQKGGLIVLCGTRRSGKTSILFQVKHGRLGEDFVPILIDMQSMTVNDDSEFITRLAGELVNAVDDPAFPGPQDCFPEPGTNPYRFFLDQVQRVNSQLGQRKLVLMFDEYELFETHIDKGRLSTDILNMLSNWMETSHGVFVIFTGSDRLEERNPHYWQTLMGKALHRRISFLSRGDTLRLIKEPVRDLVHYCVGLPERIHELTAGQPFYTQVICQSLVDRLNEEQKQEATFEDLLLTVDEIIENPLPQMIFTWSSLSSLEKISLSIIAELGRQEPVFVRPDELTAYLREAKIDLGFEPGKHHEALERLFHHDLLGKDAEGETYAFKMDLWRLWVVRMHSIWQVVDEISSGGKDPGPGLRRSVPTGRRNRRLAVAATAALAVASAVWFSALRRTVVVDGAPPFFAAATDSALLSVETEPPGAGLFWNDLHLGRSPLLPRRVAAGDGVLRVELRGYASGNASLFLARDDTTHHFMALTELTGSLNLTSLPAGAAVFLNDQPTGLRTPCMLVDLGSAARHRVVLRMANHHPGIYNDVEIAADQIAELHHDFTVMTYPLTILSIPFDAALFIDGELHGRTPYRFSDMAHGQLQIELHKDGYVVERRSIDVPAIDDMVTVDLVRLPLGRLVVRIMPFADRIYIDGELRREIAQTDSFDLEPGLHRCRLVHAQLGMYELDVEIEPGARIVLEHDFAR